MSLAFRFLCSDYPYTYQIWHQSPASLAAELIIDLHHYVMFYIILILVVVIVLMFGAVRTLTASSLVSMSKSIRIGDLFKFMYIQWCVLSTKRHRFILKYQFMSVLSDFLITLNFLRMFFVSLNVYKFILDYLMYELHLKISLNFVYFDNICSYKVFGNLRSSNSILKRFRKYIFAYLKTINKLSPIDLTEMPEIPSLRFLENNLILTSDLKNKYLDFIGVCLLHEFNLSWGDSKSRYLFWLSNLRNYFSSNFDLTKAQFPDVTNLLLNVYANHVYSLYFRKITHSWALEIFWTLIPSIILLVIAVPSLFVLYILDEPTGYVLTAIKVIGHQWYWSYEIADCSPVSFTGKGAVPVTVCSFDSFMLPTSEIGLGQFRLLEVDNPLLVPAKTPLVFLVSADDVLHSWAVPSLGIKIDAVPGRVNQVHSYITRVGEFYGQCSELCGVHHGFMPIHIIAVP